MFYHIFDMCAKFFGQNKNAKNELTNALSFGRVDTLVMEALLAKRLPGLVLVLIPRAGHALGLFLETLVIPWLTRFAR